MNDVHEAAMEIFEGEVSPFASMCSPSGAVSRHGSGCLRAYAATPSARCESIVLRIEVWEDSAAIGARK